MQKKLIFTLEEATYGFGNDAIKKHFEKKKANSKKEKGNLGTTQTKQLLVTFQSLFYDVNIEGKGADRVFVCIGERDEVLDRKELLNYSNCGQGQIPYANDLRGMVLHYLLNNHKKRTTITVKRLAYEIDALSKVLYEASRLIGAEERQEYYDKLPDIYKECNYIMFFDVVTKEANRITNHLESVLNEMEKNNIIFFRTVTNAVVISENGQEIHDIIHPSVELKIKIKQKELRQKHNITFQEVKFKLKDNAVKEYKQEEKAFLKTLGYSRVYETKLLELTATKREVEDYFKKNPLTEEFRLKHLQFAVVKAEARQHSYFNDKARIKSNKHLVEMIGGKEKKEVYVETETPYDKVYGTDLLDYDLMTQLKFSNIYADEYKESLKLLQEQ